jgi:hypothetical protein
MDFFDRQVEVDLRLRHSFRRSILHVDLFILLLIVHTV